VCEQKSQRGGGQFRNLKTGKKTGKRDQKNLTTNQDSSKQEGEKLKTKNVGGRGDRGTHRVEPNKKRVEQPTTPTPNGVIPARKKKEVKWACRTKVVKKERKIAQPPDQKTWGGNLRGP